jgi:hypothetical protein
MEEFHGAVELFSNKALHDSVLITKQGRDHLVLLWLKNIHA